MAQKLRSASIVEGVRFTATVALPNVVQGLFRRRRTAVAAANKIGVDGQAVGFMRGLRRRHDPGPVWIRVGKDQALLMLSTADVRRVLEESPRVFASDPEPKRKGMGHFQPDALTLSRGALWEDRRRFAEAVLDTGQPLHRLADRFLAVAREEAASLLSDIDAADDGELDWAAFHACVRRTTRRIVFGDSARDDEELSNLLATLMDEANSMPSKQSENFPPFMERITHYVDAAEEGSLVGLVPEAPATAQTNPPGQVIHWFFAMQDTLAINTLRALALLAVHPEQRAKAEADPAYLEACLQEAMRLWVTTPMLSRETLEQTDWDGATAPAGTQVLIVNTFHHRDPDSHDFADRFSPEAWTDGDAGDDWSFNHFSHGPQGCPGAGLALFIGTALLAELLSSREPRLLAPDLDSRKPMPHSLDYFGLRLKLDPR